MKTLSRDEVNEIIRVRQGERSLRTFAKEVGMSAAYLSDVLRCNREPGPRLLRVLRLDKRKVVTVTYSARR